MIAYISITTVGAWTVEDIFFMGKAQLAPVLPREDVHRQPPPWLNLIDLKTNFLNLKNTNHLWRQSRKQLSYRETILIGLENNLVITIGFFLRLNCRFFPQQRSSLGYPGRLWLCVKKSCAPVHEAGRGFAVACLHNRESSREEPRPLAGGGSPYFYFLRVLCIVCYKFVVNKSDI